MQTAGFILMLATGVLLFFEAGHDTQTSSSMNWSIVAQP